MPKYHLNRIGRLGNSVFAWLARRGIGPAHLLTTRGRRTGRSHSLPVILVQDSGRRWLVAPYGPVPWVLNARAAGQVMLQRGHDRHDYRIREVTAEESGPVLKRYLAVATATRPYFKATKDSPVSAFVAEAHRHPVFELTVIR